MKNPKIIGLVSLLTLCTLAMWAIWAIATLLNIALPYDVPHFLAVLIFVSGCVLIRRAWMNRSLADSMISFGCVLGAWSQGLDPSTEPGFIPLPEIFYSAELLFLVLAIISFLSMFWAWSGILFPDKPEEEPKPKKSPKPKKPSKRR